MNTLKDIRDKYKITNIRLSNILDVNKSTINTLLDRELCNFTVKQIIALHVETQEPYNSLLGETIFVPTNIDNNEQSVSILDNDNEYQRLYDKLKADLKKELTKE